MSNFSWQFRTVVCQPEAEEVLNNEIKGNQGLELLYQDLEWTLSRSPFRGIELKYPDHDFWLYELASNRSDLPTIQAVYSVEPNKVIIEFLNLDYSE